MVANELEIQLIQDQKVNPPTHPPSATGLTNGFVQTTEMEIPKENILLDEEHMPKEKSGVYIDPMAAEVSHPLLPPL
jgi:hypothetical protein